MCWRAVASPTTIWYHSSESIPLGSIHLLSSSPSWKTSTSKSISETTPMSGGSTWYVDNIHHKFIIVSMSRHQLLGVARGVQSMHSYDIIHGNLKIVWPSPSTFGCALMFVSSKTSSSTLMGASALPASERPPFCPLYQGSTLTGSSTVLLLN